MVYNMLEKTLQSHPMYMMYVRHLFVSCTNSRELTDVNKVRYDTFTPKAALSDQLPPTKDALQLHVACANYQAGISAKTTRGKAEHPLTYHLWLD